MALFANIASGKNSISPPRYRSAPYRDALREKRLLICAKYTESIRKKRKQHQIKLKPRWKEPHRKWDRSNTDANAKRLMNAYSLMNVIN